MCRVWCSHEEGSKPAQRLRKKKHAAMSMRRPRHGALQQCQHASLCCRSRAICNHGEQGLLLLAHAPAISIWISEILPARPYFYNLFAAVARRCGHLYLPFALLSLMLCQTNVAFPVSHHSPSFSTLTL
ncbi:hypothetical protein CC80DRAFT_247228 [Byssothecium circinans]|uniref:Uncharacterized protein n=1 Tax=Byssothecium circinans TaxID=147558 RepID=A0A6A5TCT3_9PLEO|nr:hypothetical protein CC80DRAFT_247228 [Byssothecium circinans]